MKFRTKVLAMITGASLLVTATVFGTWAYLTDQKEVTNTFTDGKVKIELNEVKIGTDGMTPITGTRVTDGNKYKIVPGKQYVKDPTIKVLPGSEEAYVRAKVTFTNYKRLQNAALNIKKPYTMLQDIGEDWSLVSTTGVVSPDGDNITYEYRYSLPVDEHSGIPAVFRHFTVPITVGNDGVRLLAGKAINSPSEDVNPNDVVQIKVVANAIQAEGVSNVSAAWAAFDGQNH